jgi:hypothetical protein
MDRDRRTITVVMHSEPGAGGISDSVNTREVAIFD